MNILKNILKVLKSPIWIIWFIIWAIIIAFPSYYFLDKALIIWNLWEAFYNAEITLAAIISVLFWLFLGSTLYKLKYFSAKRSTLWFLGWFIGILISWCPACSINHASYIWLAWIISVFPYYGLELKVLSVILLLFANYFTLKKLEVCSIKR
jgi:hypothetical protein